MQRPAGRFVQCDLRTIGDFEEQVGQNERQGGDEGSDDPTRHHVAQAPAQGGRREAAVLPQDVAGRSPAFDLCAEAAPGPAPAEEQAAGGCDASNAGHWRLLLPVRTRYRLAARTSVELPEARDVLVLASARRVDRLTDLRLTRARHGRWNAYAAGVRALTGAHSEPGSRMPRSETAPQDSRRFAPAFARGGLIGRSGQDIRRRRVADVAARTS